LGGTEGNVRHAGSGGDEGAVLAEDLRHEGDRRRRAGAVYVNMLPIEACTEEKAVFIGVGA
jgi:hypothetical protein